MCPVRMVINGPTLSGKSECILKLIKHRAQLFDSDFERIIYCVPHDTVNNISHYVERLRKEFPNLEVETGLPSVRGLDLEDNLSSKLVIIEDQV